MSQINAEGPGTISPKGIVRFWSCNKAVANVFLHKAEPSCETRECGLRPRMFTSRATQPRDVSRSPKEGCGIVTSCFCLPWEGCGIEVFSFFTSFTGRG